MKKTSVTTTLLFISLFIVCAQNESEFFEYKKTEYGSTMIQPKGKTNTILSKPRGLMEYFFPENINFIRRLSEKNAQAFQELIDDGTFSTDRMKELEKNEGIRITYYYDETGYVSYVDFFIHVNESSILTEKELCAIYHKYMSIKLDMSNVTVWNADDESSHEPIQSYHRSCFFSIPFKQLIY